MYIIMDGVKLVVVSNNLIVEWKSETTNAVLIGIDKYYIH